MSRPEDIPEDVWVLARQAASPQYATDIKTHGMLVRGECDSWPIVKVPARAIMAERERAAKVAEAYTEWFDSALPLDNAQQGTCHRIAVAIRKGHQ